MASDHLFELKTYQVLPGKLEEFASLTATVGTRVAQEHADLVGQWTTQTEELGQLVELWRFEDFRHRAQMRVTLAGQDAWKTFLRRSQPMLREVESLILLQSDAWPLAASVRSPVYELRDYRLHPGKTKAWLECWTRGMTIRQKFSKPSGIWYSEIGELNRIVHLWPYEDLQHRHTVRRAAIEDPLWRETVATLATMMQRMESKILVPTAASKLK